MSTSPLSDRRSNPLAWQNVVCLLVLVGACLVSRVPSLDLVALDPDESQYEATAAYLLATGADSFSLPYGGGFTFGLYKLVGRMFGPYAMHEMRVLVLLLCLATAVLVYAMVRRLAGYGAGLVAGLVFVYLNLAFEGLTANREWFSAIFLVAGVRLYWSSVDRPASRELAWLFLAGLVSGMSFWFKLQVVYMLVTVPLVSVWQSFSEGQPRRILPRWTAYGAGGLAALGLGWLPYLLAGNLTNHVRSIFSDWGRYVVENEASVEASAGTLSLYVENFFLNRLFATFLWVSYAFVLLCLAGIVFRAVNKRRLSLPLIDHPLVVAIVFLHVTAIVSIQMGQRYLDHYYLYLAPTTAAIFGITIGMFATAREDSRILKWTGLCMAALLLIHRPLALAGIVVLPPSRVMPFLLIANLALVIGLGVWLIGRGLRSWRAALVALMVFEAVLLLAGGHVLAWKRSLPWHPRGFPELVSYLEAAGDDGDRLFVWGWLPEIYSLTRMEPASHMTVCQYVVNDYQAVAAPRLNEPMAQSMMADLVQRPPRFIVDAADRSWTLEGSDDPWIYRLELYPDFEFVDFLHRNYVRKGPRDGCDVWVRREPG